MRSLIGLPDDVVETFRRNVSTGWCINPIFFAFRYRLMLAWDQEEKRSRMYVLLFSARFGTMRQQLLNRQFSTIAIATFTLALSVATSAQALPGQRVQAVIQWAKQHPVLSPLKRGIGELSGLPFYNSQTKVNLGTLNFSMNPDRADQTSQEETIALGTRSPFSGFTRTSSSGLNLIGKIYDQKLTTDFTKSAYIAKVTFHDYEIRFYRGQSFGYMTTEFKSTTQDGQKYHHFRVLPLGNLSQEITSTQQCRKQSAYGCE